MPMCTLTSKAAWQPPARCSSRMPTQTALSVGQQTSLRSKQLESWALRVAMALPTIRPIYFPTCC
ncbi:hypothetical protein HaLaN_07112, partial [Haematococcus lacustris]